MKKLTKMLLINWHNYSFQEIHFEDINFLTGKTGSGKSTIIDAFQLVLLGDTNGSFFNKAANQKSTRSLKDYLFGDQGDDGDVGFKYLRGDKPFTSYIALEFFDTENKRSFTNIFVADCHEDRSFDAKWFILEKNGIPETNFLKDGVPLSINKLKSYLAATLKKDSDYSFFTTNKAYQNAMLEKFGLDERYLSLLKKAVPFTPISDITKFITESICDVDDNINIDQMSSDIRAYKELETKAKNVEKQIKELKSIKEAFNVYKEYEEQIKEYRYIVDKAELDEKIAYKESLTSELEQCTKRQAEIQVEIERFEDEKLELNEKLNELRKELYTTSPKLQAERLEKERDELKQRCREYTVRVDELCEEIKEKAEVWLEVASCFKKYSLSISDDDNTTFYLGSRISRETLTSYDLNTLHKAITRVNEKYINHKGKLDSEIKKLRAEADETKAVIEKLEQGIKPYPKKALELASIISALTHTDCKFLADVLELEDESWRGTVESYLGSRRFYLLVDEKYYEQVLKEAEKIGPEVGMIDSRMKGDVTQNSLATVVRTENKMAQNYINSVLGGIEKVDVIDPQSTKDSASRELYIHADSAFSLLDRVDPYIGRDAIVIQLEQNKEKLKYLVQDLNSLRAQQAEFDSCQTIDAFVSHLIKIQKEVVEDYKTIPNLEKQIEKINEQLDSLDLDTIKKLEDKIALTNSKLKHCEKALSDKQMMMGGLFGQVKELKEERLPNSVNAIAEKNSYIEETYDKEWRDLKGDKRYLDAVKVERAHRSLREAYSSKQTEFIAKQSKAFSKLVEERANYNQHYSIGFDARNESNEAYDNELVKLESVELPSYSEKIINSKERAFRQFKEEFISKIKENIEAVKRQISELNYALKEFSFGTDSYKFEVLPNKDYRKLYDMFTDDLIMGSGVTLMSGIFEDKYKEEIDELFSVLIYDKDTLSGKDLKNYEQKIALYVDYRTYLTFDLIVTDQDGESQRLSKTMTKKSGGETQLPFYIALLASFSRACKIGSRVMSNTMRLIILDEAFSKMDGERIQESIRLLKKFQLQAIFSAPPEKIPDISPLVSNTLVVNREKNSSYVMTFEKEFV